MSEPVPPNRRWSGVSQLPGAGFWIFTLVLVGLKLWLVAAQPVVAHANASFDDRLFVALAEQVLKGNWLGPYSQFTLMKGPMYSLFIAASAWLRIPLPITQHLFYLFGCALFVLALRPHFRARWQPLTLFALLWWQPMSYVELDVVRQNIYTPLTLLLFAGLCAIETRRSAGTWTRIGWGMLLGITAGAFYLTREEGIWVVPGAAMLIGVAAWNSWRSRERLRRLIAPLSAAVVCAAVILGSVCMLNFRHYGWFGTVEFRAREFVSAYGSMLRPIPSEKIPYVPVTREVRLKLYDVSSSFTELKPCLEGPVGQEWANYSDYLTGRPGEELQIGGGSFMWALRDCVVGSGHARSAREALDFYGSLANEINRACDDGRVGPTRARRNTMVPSWQPYHWRRLWQTAPGYVTDFFLFRGFSAYPTASWGTADLLELFRNLTHWRLAHSDEAPELDAPSSSPLNDYRLTALEFIGQSMRWICVAVVISGLVAWVRAAIQSIRERRVSYLFVLSIALFGSALAVLLVNLLVDVLAFRNRGVTALHEGYPLLLIFGTIAWFAAWPNNPREKAQRSPAIPSWNDH